MIEIERHVRRGKEINLVPLINIIFLLLTFFLVAGSLQKYEVLQVDPPIALSGEEMNQGSIVLVLGRYNEILFNDELITADRVVPLLREQVAINRARPITVRADARVKAVALIETLERVHAAGGFNLTLATQAP